jgi:pimeloyl-ACP methyl ester carboxylesterase
MRHLALLLGAACLLAGCATAPAPQERLETATALAVEHGWQGRVIHAGRFDMMAWLPEHITPSPDLTVYLEGDGLAWLSPDTPSPDPTPVNPIGLRLALAQPGGNAAYLARPCQYVRNDACSAAYWTNARFAPETVAATRLAVDDLARRFGARRLTLVGYSGGASIAALVTARRSDVVRLVTVAGNLDHRQWTRLHGISPLTGSLDAADERDALRGMPQWHFVGGRDRVVPPVLVQDFAVGMPDAHVIVLNDYDHRCCWAEHWKDLWQSIH